MNALSPRLSPDITFGHLLTTLSFLVFGLGAFFVVKADVSILNERVSTMQSSVSTMAISVAALADKRVVDVRQDERIAAYDRRVERMKRILDNLETRVRDSVSQPKQ